MTAEAVFREERLLEEELTPWQRVGRSLLGNPMAMAGGFFLILFFALAFTGWWATSDHEFFKERPYLNWLFQARILPEKPYFDPSQVRLPDRLKAPLTAPNSEAVPVEAHPRLGVYLLGTDALGRDVFARMLGGAKVSMAVGFVAVGISIILGVIMGGVAGFYRDHKPGLLPALLAIAAMGAGWLLPWPEGGRFFFVEIALAALGAVFGALAERIPALSVLARLRLPRVDTLFISLVDLQLSFPTFFLILTVIAILPPSIWNIMIVIGITGWVGPARFVRAEILSLRERPFIEAAQAIGAKDARLIFVHLVPNSLAPVLVSATIGIASAILTEAALSFLGFGVPPPDATWGNILSDGKKFLFDAPWLTFIPGFAISIFIPGFIGIPGFAGFIVCPYKSH